MFEGALMYGTASDKLMDAAREGITQSTDFTTITPVKVRNIGSTTDQEGSTVFNDDGAGSSKLGIKTIMLTYSYTNPPNDNFIIIRTKFENTTQANISGLYAGYYFDFDIPATGNDYSDDMVTYNAADNFGYAYDLDGQPQTIFIGAALVSSDNQGFYAINQDSVTGEVTPNSTDGFNDSEKWYAISHGLKKLIAGPADISYVISGGPFNVEAGKTIDVAFSLACGSSVEEVRAAIRQSRIKYQSIPTDVRTDDSAIPSEFVLYQNYPNPFNPSTIISYRLPEAGQVTLKVYDMLGREITTLVSELKQPGVYNATFNILNSSLTSGIYFYKLQAGKYSDVKKMILLK